ncbi:hypothetical protein ACA910_019561 [Epithemia clementina (nom. ined.)]
MVLSFFEDPLEGASNSSRLNVDTDNVASVDDGSSLGADSHSVTAGGIPFDENSVEARPIDPEFFYVPVDSPGRGHPTIPNLGSSQASVVQPLALQSRRSALSPSRPFSCRSDIVDLPLPLPPKLSSSALKLPPINWHDAFCSDFHLQLIASPALWSSFVSSFSKVTDPPLLQKFLEWDLKDHVTAFLCSD